MNEDEHELDQLDHGYVLLPPEVALHLRSESGEEVVDVHEDVHTGVDEACQELVSAWQPTDVDVGHEGHDGVMNDVKDGDLVELLAEHKAELKKLCVITNGPLDWVELDEYQN